MAIQMLSLSQCCGNRSAVIRHPDGAFGSTSDIQLRFMYAGPLTCFFISLKFDGAEGLS